MHINTAIAASSLRFRAGGACAHGLWCASVPAMSMPQQIVIVKTRAHRVQ
ncbi:MAG: hypothetical protein P4L83_10545 [Nevskia sp.]|nr:hypothetical protein [Nevskia sp.]